MLVFVADDQQLRTLIFWTMGGFGSVTWVAITPALLILLISVPTLLPTAHLLDALALGEREAGHVGVDVERLKRRLVAQVALAVGAGVAISGIVGFVGLIAPHIVRLLLGPSHRTLLPAAALFGGAFLVLADAHPEVVEQIDQERAQPGVGLGGPDQLGLGRGAQSALCRVVLGVLNAVFAWLGAEGSTPAALPALALGRARDGRLAGRSPAAPSKPVELIEPLSARFTLYIPDLVGAGRTMSPEKPCTPEAVSEWLRALQDRLGDRKSVV